MPPWYRPRSSPPHPSREGRTKRAASVTRCGRARARVARGLVVGGRPRAPRARSAGPPSGGGAAPPAGIAAARLRRPNGPYAAGPDVSNVKPKTSPTPKARTATYSVRSRTRPRMPMSSRPVEDVRAEPVRIGLVRDHDPAGRDEHRQERDQEDVQREPRPAPLRPAAEDLRERHHEARGRDQPVDGPVAAGRAAVDLRREPDQQARGARAEQRDRSSCQAVHGTTSAPVVPARREVNRRYCSVSRRLSKLAE